MTAEFTHDKDTPVYVISVAAELAGMHAQTLRQYDRLGIVTPSRTRGGGRRYSQRDVEMLREVQRLSQEDGISLPGITRIMQLQDQMSAMQLRIEELLDELDAVHPGPRIFSAGSDGQIVTLRPGQRPHRPVTGRQLVLYRGRHSTAYEPNGRRTERQTN